MSFVENDCISVQVCIASSRVGSKIKACTTFDFSRIDEEAVKARIEFVAEQENISLDEGVSSLLAKLADGSMRDGLSILERCVLACGDSIDASDTTSVLGIADSDCNTKAAECMEKIFVPTMEAMKSEGRTFKGCIFFGLMITPNGPKVIEYNCRFGDPETQVVLPLLETDLLTIMKAVAEERLAEVEVKFSNKSACCVIMASAGYPESYEKGFEITLPENDDLIFIAGAKEADGKLLTNGGRVLGVTELADTLPEAIAKSYESVKTVKFDNAFYRNDIGKKALEAEV